jgi:putative SOS response-associated peptidase YedK
MCGRFSLSSNLEELQNEFSNEISGNFPAKYNISPGQSPVVISLKKNNFYLNKIHWGFKVPKLGKLVINARSETIIEKPLFKNLLLQNRCLIPANSWFEWDNEKKPYLIKHKKNDIIAFAGLQRIEENQESSFVIITADAEKDLKTIHKRTPLVINKENFLFWLGNDYEKACNILKPINSNDYIFYPVSPKVGKISNDNISVTEKYHEKESQLNLFSN